MGPTALTPTRTGEEVGLRFDQPGGPVVALCGLVGGAGTSTLSYLLATRAARESHAPVLLCEAEALAGGLAVLAGHASPLGLSQLATLIDAEKTPECAPVAQIDGGLRLLATLPRASAPAGPTQPHA